MDLPFRWDVVRREQLGRLAVGSEAESYAGFMDDLRTCCSRVLGICEDADLVFIGRSPESVFDYLSGILLETSWRDRIALLNLSFRDSGLTSLRVGVGPDVHVLRRHLSGLHLSPREIATRERPVAFVDLVASGSTFEILTRALLDWTRDEGFDANAVIRRLRFIGITWRTKTSPKTWRWHQGASWLAPFRPSAVKNVSIPGRLWDYLGNQQPKVARSQPPSKWQDESWRFSPPHEDAHLQSLRLALRIFDTARTRQEQRAFTTAVMERSAPSKPWLRAVVSEIRKTRRRSA
jgi:hypothetical protein